MSNPWLKKNPFMSMWLSAANRMVGSMRGQAAAQVKREISSVATSATNDRHLKAVLNAKASTTSGSKSRAKAGLSPKRR